MVSEAYDVLVIGGGINGCATARHAAQSGLHTALVEKNDFGCGVTSRSTRLIHGGLRYLESGQVSLVRESLRDRYKLLEDYPGQVKPLEFLIPVYESDSRAPWYIQVGLAAYSFLARNGRLPKHRRVSPREIAELAPALDQEGLRAGFLYFDCQAPYPERLALEMALEAEQAGATVLNHAPVTGIIAEDGRVAGVRIRRGAEPEGEERELRARLVINAAGAWADHVRQLLPGGPQQRRLLTLLNGAHIVVRPFEGAPCQAVYHEARTDRRPFFIIPWRKLYLIGTTETPFEGDPEDVEPTQEEIGYLLKETNSLLPGSRIGEDDILYSYAGPRPLVRASGKNFNRASREHAIYDHEPEEGLGGMLTLVGGKLTTARTFASQVVEAAAKKLGRRAGDGPQKPADQPRGAPDDLDPRLTEIYGRRAGRLQELLGEHPEWREPFAPGASTVAGEVLFAVREEKAETLGDILLRRTGAAFDPGYGEFWAERAAALAAPELGWDQGAVERQLEACRSEREKTLRRARLT